MYKHVQGCMVYIKRNKTYLSMHDICLFLGIINYGYTGQYLSFNLINVIKNKSLRV